MRSRPTEELNAVDESTRQKITWTIIIAVVVSLILLAVHRRHEVDNLIAEIESGSLTERIAAVRTLMHKQKFAEALEDRSRWAQTQAVEAATMIGTEQSLFQLIACKSLVDAPVAAAVDEYLISMGETAIGPLVQALQDKDGAVRGGAKGPLVAIGEPAVKSLMPLIDVYDDAVRGLVAGTLAGIGEPAVKPLLRILKQREPLFDQEPAAFDRARRAAQSAFVSMGVVAFAPITEQVLTDDNPEVRSKGATILGSIADQTTLAPLAAEDAAQVVGPLVNLLQNDPNWSVRVKAAAALGPLVDVAKDNGAVGPLIARLADARPEVRAAAAKALGEIADPSAAGPLAATLMTNRTGATTELATALERIGKPSIAPLTPALDHGDAEVRLVATETIATVGGANAVVPLGKALGDKDVRVRQEAAKALRNLADARVLEPLARALADEDWHVYHAASEALAHVGPPAIPTLVAALGHPNTRVAYMAEKALARIGKPAISALTVGLKSDNPQVVEWTAIALGDIGYDAIEPTAKLLNDASASAISRAAAARALGMTKSKDATKPLIAAAKSASPQVRKAVVKALSEVGDADATETLVGTLLDPSDAVRATAASALKAWRMGGVDAQLRKIMKSGDINAARRAAIVLAQHTTAAGGGLLARVAGIGGEAGLADEEPVRKVLEAAAKDDSEQASLRKGAIETLGYVGTEASLDALSPLLTTGNPYAQEAAKAVGRIGEKVAEEQEVTASPELSKAAELLLKVFHSADTDELRLVAAAGLSLMGGQPVKALLEDLEGPRHELRPWIVAILGAIGKPATDPVLDVRGASSDKEVKAWCAAALKLIGDARALDFLDRMPEEDQPSPEKIEAGQAILSELRATL